MGRKKNVVAPNNERALVEMEKMAVDIEKARELYGDGQPFDEERILDCIVFRAERASHEIEIMGKYCLWYSVEAGHGNFLKGLERRNIDIKAAYWAMAIVEKFASNFAALRNLGVTKARFLTAFSKEEIDEYVQGGDLGDIPHDDVAKMTTRELGAEVRKLRKELKQTEDVAKKKIKQKDDEISKLELENDFRQPPTKEQLAQRNLEQFDKDYFSSIADAEYAVDKCKWIIKCAQKTEGISFEQLNAWMIKNDESIESLKATIDELWETIDDIHVDKGGE